MSGWMSYQRARTRNGLMHRKPDDNPDPYWRGVQAAVMTEDERVDNLMLIGDLNRMERDYLDPIYPQPPFASRQARSDPATQCADATGVDVETVRKVLRYVFLEQP